MSLIRKHSPVHSLAVFLIITRTEGYGNDKHCWLSVESGLLWAFVIPAMLVVIVNAVIMVLVLRRISQANVRSNAPRNKIRSLIRNILVILPILGLTWVFGVVAVNSHLVAFQFIFAVANSLQGVFIFIFHAFCRGKTARSAKKKSKASGPWNPNTESAPTMGQNSNGSSQHLVTSEDSSGAGTDNLGYDNDQVSSTSFTGGTKLASPEARKLPRHSELVRDHSVFGPAVANDARQWRRLGKAIAERPGLSRFVSDMSDASNSTTSTFVSTTPSQSGSGLELSERL